jgi:hypothetical protein
MGPGYEEFGSFRLHAGSNASNLQAASGRESCQRLQLETMNARIERVFLWSVDMNECLSVLVHKCEIPYELGGEGCSSKLNEVMGS